MSYLIDGSNLGGVGGGARGARNARAVVEWLLPWVRARKADRGRIRIVFDGAPKPDVAHRYGGLEVEFAAPRSADDAILAAVRQHPRRWIVVTDDAALARACRDLGAKTQAASSLFEKKVVPAIKTPKPPRTTASDKPTPSGSDQGHWKRIFLDSAKSDEPDDE